jgi:hypothetical protein
VDGDNRGDCLHQVKSQIVNVMAGPYGGEHRNWLRTPVRREMPGCSGIARRYGCARGSRTS